MGKKHSARLVLLVTACLLVAAGCATITRRGTQAIPITSSPGGAAVSVGGKTQGTTPLLIRLPRKTKGQVIRIESPGYNPVEIRPRRVVPGMPIVGNFLLGVVPGFFPALGWGMNHENAPDLEGLFIWALGAAAFGAIFTVIDTVGVGTGYELRPKELTVTLTRSEGPPRVDTMFLDLDDLRNIKWIRVRRN